jgi:hypothetical protein
MLFFIGGSHANRQAKICQKIRNKYHADKSQVGRLARWATAVEQFAAEIHKALPVASEAFMQLFGNEAYHAIITIIPCKRDPMGTSMWTGTCLLHHQKCWDCKSKIVFHCPPSLTI